MDDINLSIKELKFSNDSTLNELNQILDILLYVDNLLKNNQLIRARNIASYDLDMRTSLDNLIIDENFEKILNLVEDNKSLIKYLKNHKDLRNSKG